MLTSTLSGSPQVDAGMTADATGSGGARAETLDHRIAALSPGVDLFLPKGQGPFPVLIQLHGCGGKKKLQGEWAAVAQAQGWAAVVVDSYAHRNISTLQAYMTVCTGLHLWGQERAGDLFAAMEWVRRQKWADASRIVVAGWSHGGWTALDAMALQPGEDAARTTRLSGLPAEPLRGLVGAFLVYPFAGPGALAPSRGLRVDVAPLALVGGADVIVGGRSLARTLERMKTPGDPVKIVMLDGATHAFDEREARDLRTRHDPALTLRAHELLKDYLRAAMARTPSVAPS